MLATDAPLLPGQCRRRAQRATVDVARVGGLGENSIGDIFLAFSTGNRGLTTPRTHDAVITVRMVPHDALMPLCEAAANATEEAIVNGLCAAVTMTGVNGHTAYALPLDRLQAAMPR